ncbi:MAG: hypothetical protein AB4062_10545, partial [Crocosphaera sp.]
LMERYYQMSHPNAKFQSMTNQQLRAYFRETRDENAFREILDRGLDEQDKAIVRAFKAWKDTKEST